ncbi:hypothetical protein ABZX62_34205 [Streptomyces flavidovirens]|uniref:DUF7919 domain-containing protein n=1 Tax=Streptomyces flavidovirens TaxID=67298 RepID=A0ABW6RLL8_9ACTN
MTYYADLTPYTYDTDIDRSSPGPEETDGPASRAFRGLPQVNVGWLARVRPYAKGDAPPGLVEALKAMQQTHRVQQTRGYHFCPWCAARLLGLVGARDNCPRGSAEIRVIGEGVVYAAPELITHYVEAHGYAPPAEFVRAVLASSG